MPLGEEKGERPNTGQEEVPQYGGAYEHEVAPDAQDVANGAPGGQVGRVSLAQEVVVRLDVRALPGPAPHLGIFDHRHGNRRGRAGPGVTVIGGGRGAGHLLSRFYPLVSWPQPALTAPARLRQQPVQRNGEDNAGHGEDEKGRPPSCRRAYVRGQYQSRSRSQQFAS